MPAEISLIESYLATTVKRYAKEHTVFAPWLILEDMGLARSVAKAIATRVGDPKSSGVCILADSGIPLGVLTAQALGQPMHFFRRDPWLVDYEPGPLSIYPPIPSGSVISLIDSHIMSGFTASTCHDMLGQQGVSVDKVITAINLQDIAQGTTYHRPNVDYLSLSDASSHKDTMLVLLRGSSWTTIGDEIRKAVNRSRHHTVQLNDSDEMGKLIPKSNMLLTIIRHLLVPIRDKLRVHYVSDELASELRGKFGSTESEIWRFFTYPDLVKRTCEISGEVIEMNEYDVVVGTDYLGTILALCLAWHNGFSGMILSTRSAFGWEGLEATGKGTRCLICSARLRTGYKALGAARRLLSYGAKPNKLLALRLCLEGVGYPRRRVIFGLKRLQLEITAVS